MDEINNHPVRNVLQHFMPLKARHLHYNCFSILEITRHTKMVSLRNSFARNFDQAAIESLKISPPGVNRNDMLFEVGEPCISIQQAIQRASTVCLGYFQDLTKLTNTSSEKIGENKPFSDVA